MNVVNSVCIAELIFMFKVLLIAFQFPSWPKRDAKVYPEFSGSLVRGWSPGENWNFFSAELPK